MKESITFADGFWRRFAPACGYYVRVGAKLRVVEVHPLIAVSGGLKHRESVHVSVVFVRTVTMTASARAYRHLGKTKITRVTIIEYPVVLTYWQ